MIPDTDIATRLQRLLAGTLDPRRLTLTEEHEIRKHCRLGAERSADGIRKLHLAGHWKNSRRASRRHLRRTEVILCGLFVASRKRWRTRLHHSAEEREALRIKRLQAIFDCWRKAGSFTVPARARISMVPKKNNQGMRPVTDFHWLDRARQFALRSTLDPVAEFHDAQFMLARDPAHRGPTALRNALLAALNDCGDDCLFVQFDVRAFYTSFDHGWLERNLGLDPVLVRRQLHVGEMRLTSSGEMDTRHGQHDASKEGGQRGIPQGSSLSSFVAEWVMADVLRSAVVLEDLPCFVWSDNIGVLVPRRRVGEVVDATVEAFAKHGAGPFTLTHTKHEVSSEFKFIGTYYKIHPERGAIAFVPQDIADRWSTPVRSPLLDGSISDLLMMDKAIVQKRAQWGWWSGWGALEAEMRAALISALYQHPELPAHLRQWPLGDAELMLNVIRELARRQRPMIEDRAVTLDDNLVCAA